MHNNELTTNNTGNLSHGMVMIGSVDYCHYPELQKENIN